MLDSSFHVTEQENYTNRTYYILCLMKLLLIFRQVLYEWVSSKQNEWCMYDEDRNLLALEKGGLYFDMWHLLSGQGSLYFLGFNYQGQVHYIRWYCSNRCSYLLVIHLIWSRKVPYWSSWSKWSISCLSDEGLCISDNVTQDAIILGYVLFGSWCC